MGKLSDYAKQILNPKPEPPTNESGPQSTDKEFWCPEISTQTPYLWNDDPEKYKQQTNKTWLTLEAFYVDKFVFDVKEMPTGKSGTEKYIFHFLMPREHVENLAHEWASFESIASRMSELYARVGGSVKAQVSGLNEIEWSKNFKEAAKQIKENPTKNLPDETAKLLSNISSMKGTLPLNKVDSPLYYKFSPRRTFEFMVYLTVTNKNRWKEVVKPVRFLQYLSSPAKSDKYATTANTEIFPPFVFKITTSPVFNGNPNKLLHIPVAALTNVQPTFKGPWIEGIPTSCELRLSFIEYMPLFDEVFDEENGPYKKIVTARATGGGK